MTAGPVFASQIGLPCQKMTQTIDIGGQNVHAAAVLCQQPNGAWRIQPTQSARIGNATRTSGLSSE